MTNEPIPDPFASDLAARMQAATTPIEGRGVTAAGVEAAAIPLGQHRQRRVVVAMAASVAVVLGLAAGAMALRGDNDRPAKVRTADAPTTATPTVTDETDPGPATTVSVPETATTVEEVAPSTATTVSVPEPVTTTAVLGDNCAEPETPAGAVVLRRIAGEQPEGATDLVLFTEAQVASLRQARIISDDQVAAARNDIYIWIYPEQYDHLQAQGGDLAVMQSFGYAAYPDRSGGTPGPIIVEVQPACLGIKTPATMSPPTTTAPAGS